MDGWMDGWMDRLSYLAPGSSANLRQDRTDRLTESPERQPPRSRFSSLPPLHVNPIALSKWAQNERGMLPRARARAHVAAAALATSCMLHVTYCSAVHT